MVTIDITDDVIRVVTFQGNGVKFALEEPVDPGLIKDGLILNPKAVGRIIKGIFSNNGIREKNVIVSISGIHSIYRVSRLPKFSRDIMTEAVNQEMARVIPVPLNELYVSWQDIPTGGVEVIVPMLGIPREMVDFTLSALREAGLNTKLMDIKPLALARVADETTAMVINIQPNCFDIVISVDGIPELIRSLSFSEDSTSLEDKMREFEEELEKTVSFFNSNNPDKQLPPEIPVFVSGPLADIVAGRISYQVRRLPDLFLYPTGFNVNSFVVNIGLALKQGKIKTFPISVNFNVLPAAYLPKAVSLMQLFSWVFLIIAVVILIFSGINVAQVLGQNASLQKQITDLSAQVESRGTSVPDAEKLQTQLNYIQKERDTLQGVIDSFAVQRDNMNKDLGIITSSVSGKIIIASISYTTAWTVKGLAPDAETAFNYVSNLQASNRFSLVELSSINELTYYQWEFVITVTGTQ
jgi:type IV pilus assembly protein PilM